MSIKIEMLRCFCAVAQAGNLSDAANRLGRTQSAVSMMLKQFEETVGNRLFEGERKNRLTSLGEQVFELGQIQLKQFDSTVAAIQTLSHSPQGVLRISAVPSVAALAFPPIVRHMSEAHPGLRLELRDADTPQVLESLTQGWADLGIASAHHELHGITSTKLFQDHFGLVLSEDHPLAQSDGPIRCRDVFASPFLRNALCDHIQSPEIRNRLSEANVTVYNTQSLLAMVREGGWVTILPHSTVRLIRTGLVFRPIADLAETRQVHLLARERPSSPELALEASDLIRSLQWPGID